ncbi:hypothetical protein J6590_094489 [Homalodisca vitripennis]|nr:hypothetical protein J6590_094489 [Homalodisca vitripennis]
MKKDPTMKKEAHQIHYRYEVVAAERKHTHHFSRFVDISLTQDFRWSGLSQICLP